MSVFNFQNKDVFYQLDDAGKNQTLVILNGIMMSHKSWETFMPALLKHVNVLRVDFLDQGASSKMDEPYTQTIQVKLLKALFDYLKLSNMTVMGISYGASVALQYAVNHQNDLNGLLLFNVTAKTNPWLRDIGRGWNEVAKTKNGEAYYHITIPYIYSPHFYQTNIQWMDNRKKLLVPLFSDADFLDAMIRLTNSAESHDVSNALPTIETRTLIVASEHDYLTPVDEQQAIHEHMPNSDLIILPTCGHASMYEKPGVFIQTILGFIAENGETYQL